MSDTTKQYVIPDPIQTKIGGWIGKVLADDKTTVLMETFQPSKNFAFMQCVYWCIAENHKNSTVSMGQP